MAAQEHTWTHRRELRSSVTMMRYLARTTGHPSTVNGNLHHKLSVADRRQGHTSAPLRHEQEWEEAQLQTRVHTMAIALEEGAHAKAHAKAIAAAVSKQSSVAAEHAARVMGAGEPEF